MGSETGTASTASTAGTARRLLVDEDMARSTTAALREAGYTADDVRDVGLRGRSDPEVFAYAQAHGRILVTADKGFTNTLAYPLGTHAGIMVVRVPDELPTRIANDALLRTLEALEGEDLAGVLVIVELGRARIRRP